MNALPSIDVVVSAFCEKLDWLYALDRSRFRNVFIYRKKYEYTDLLKLDPKCKIVYLPNVGMCDHTYLYHIITRYNDLADLNVFLPGTCDTPGKVRTYEYVVRRTVNENVPTMVLQEALPNVCTFFHAFRLDYYVPLCLRENEHAMNRLKPCSIRPFGTWYRNVFGDFDTSCFMLEGMFSVSSYQIRMRSQTFYTGLIRYVDKHVNTEAAHYIERAWCAVFNVTSRF
jgi:hypothetical protein